jgi:osmoprotectant transport system substrate-binding protein
MAACGSEPGRESSPSALDDEAITIASFDFSESELLAELYSQALEDEGFSVERAFNLGPREFVMPALVGALVEFVPEYAGTALQFLNLGESSGAADIGSTHDALVRTLDGSGLTVLTPAPAQDANGFVATRETAERLDLHSISDLSDVADDLVLGGPPECPTRPLCLAGLERLYGLMFDDFLPLDAGGPLTRQALAQGHVDVALLFTTDPSILRDDLVLLDDDRGMQPAENVVPLVRKELAERFGPDFVRTVDEVSRLLTTDGLRELNARVATGRLKAPAVAARWLSAEGLVATDRADR